MEIFVDSTKHFSVCVSISTKARKKKQVQKVVKSTNPNFEETNSLDVASEKRRPAPESAIQ